MVGQKLVVFVDTLGEEGLDDVTDSGVVFLASRVQQSVVHRLLGQDMLERVLAMRRVSRAIDQVELLETAERGIEERGRVTVRACG